MPQVLESIVKCVLTKAITEVYFSYTPESQNCIAVEDLIVQGRPLAPASVDVSGSIMRLNLEAIWRDHDWKAEADEIYVTMGLLG